MTTIREHYWMLRARVLARLRKVRPLPSEPLGTLVVGTARFPVDRLTLDRGLLVVSGEVMNPFPGGMAGAGWPRTYQLLDKDGGLVRESGLPWSGDIGTSRPGMSWRLDMRMDIRTLTPRGEG